MVGRTLGHYRVTEKLGEGGMGVVYRAEDTKLGREVALKILSERLTHDATRLARFEREARLLASLNHPNIAAIYGFEEANGQRFLVLELVEGEDLAQRLKRGTLPLDDTLDVARQVCDALEAAHERGVIHRDLKPANVKVTPGGKVKVLDFGLAKAIAGDSDARDLSQSPTISEILSREGVVLGTAAYMSPEQARGKPLDKRTDIWSFGCLLYELLTARGPFGGDTVSDCIGAILHREPDWALLPPETPSRVRQLLRRCLEKDFKRRLRDIGDARLELEDALEKPTLEIPGAGYDLAPTPRWRQVLPWALAGLLGVALALALLLPRRAASPAPVTRFTIQLPENQALGGLGRPAMAFSPDGSRLVYVARQSGISQLYLRPLDSLEATALPGTEGASGPVISPDGEWVAFLVSRNLKKVSLRDGSVVNVAVVPPISCGHAWAPDGAIIYSWGRGMGGLRRMPAAGGDSKVLTTPDAGRGEIGHCWPEVLPGGKAVLFSVQVEGGWDKAGTAAARLNDQGEIKEWKTLIEGGTNARYLADGRLLYARGDRLFIVSFDPDRLELTGTAAPVVDAVRVNPFNGAAQFSVSPGGSLAYLSGHSRDAKTTLVWVDRQGNAQALNAPPRSYGIPRFSPDGRRLALTVEEGSEDIWVYDLARGTLARVTTDPSRELGAVWTPDGARLIFSSDKNRRPHDMFWKAADGSGDVHHFLLFPLDQQKTFPDFAFEVSPDGRMLLYAEDNIMRKGTGWDLFSLPLQGEPKPVPFIESPFDELQPTVSPDGRWVAYASNETGRFEIYVQSYPAPGQKTQVSTEGGLEPRWARSGGELFYRNGGKMMGVAVSPGPALQVGAPQLLFEGPFNRGGINPGYAEYDVSPDGQRFLMIRSEQEGGATQMTVVLNWLDSLRTSRSK
ncbi:MAG: protein kinase domain-containing protein [Candidatus Acidiferrales bacterium]